MSYLGDCKLTQTPDERRAEANRIMKILIECDIDSSLFTDTERDFVEKMTDYSEPVSPRQLLWLRDIKAKYAE